MAKPSKKKSAKKPAAKAKPAAATDPGTALETAQPFKWLERKDLIPLGIVLVVAFALRVVFFYLNKSNNPVFFYPIMDALYHHEWAEEILTGSYRADDVYFRAPLYPYLVAFLYKISGSSLAFVVFVQHLIGTLTAGFVYLLSRELFSKRVSLLAGLLGALYWPLVYFEGDLLIVTTIIFLNTLTFLFLVKSVRNNSLPLLIAAGLVLGLSAVARPSVLIVFPVIPLVLYLNRQGSSAQSRVGWLARSAIMLAATLVVISPVMIRNYVVGRSVVPIAASGGVNFWIGNNPVSDGSTAIVPGTRADWWGGYHDAIAIAERDEGRKLNLAGVSNYFFKRGINWITGNPGDATSHFLKKLRIFWAGPERANNKFLYFFWNLAGMKYVPLPGFWFIAPLALLGGVLQWRRRRELSLLYLFILIYMAGVVAFFVNARFRLPIVPYLVIFAAYAILYLITVFKQKDFRLIKAIAILAGAVIIVNEDYLTFNKIRSYSTAFSHSTLGNAYMKMNRKEKALEHYVRAWELHESAPTEAYKLISRDIDYNMGLLLWEKGLCTRAIEALRRVGSSPNPEHRTDEYAQNALDYLGDCLLRKGEVDKAFTTYQEFMRINPGDARAVTGLAKCVARTGNLEEAESMLISVTNSSGNVHVPAYVALAEIQRGMGKIDEAIGTYGVVTRFYGFERDAYVALAEIYQEAGDIDSAIRTLEKAVPYFPPGDATIRGWINRLRNLR
jgi:tetratricopeptide (TPR) repeat protein